MLDDLGVLFSLPFLVYTCTRSLILASFPGCTRRAKKTNQKKRGKVLFFCTGERLGTRLSSTHHDCSKAQYLSIVLQDLNEVFLWWLGNERQARLFAVLQGAKPIVRGQRLCVCVCVCVCARVCVCVHA